MLAFENGVTLQLENAEPVALSRLIPSRDKQEGKLLEEHGKRDASAGRKRRGVTDPFRTA